MAQTQTELNPRHSKLSGASYQETSVKVTEVEPVKSETKPEAASVVAPTEDCPSSQISGVRPSVAASLENSIEKNAAVWIALANH